MMTLPHQKLDSLAAIVHSSNMHGAVPEKCEFGLQTLYLLQLTSSTRSACSEKTQTGTKREPIKTTLAKLEENHVADNDKITQPFFAAMKENQTSIDEINMKYRIDEAKRDARASMSCLLLAQQAEEVEEGIKGRSSLSRATAATSHRRQKMSSPDQNATSVALSWASGAVQKLESLCPGRPRTLISDMAQRYNIEEDKAQALLNSLLSQDVDRTEDDGNKLKVGDQSLPGTMFSL
jgi:hypothetical protein